MSDSSPDELVPDEGDLAAAERLKDGFTKLKTEMGKVIVIQRPVPPTFEELELALMAGAS